MTFDRKVTKWKAVVYHLKGQARDEQLYLLLLSKNTVCWILSVSKGKKKKTIEQLYLLLLTVPSMTKKNHNLVMLKKLTDI